MKTLDYVIANWKSETLDGRDMNRLSDFVPEDRLKEIGVKMKDEFVGQHKTKEWTRENILEQLKEDVDFGFEKALNQRGISSSAMFECVRLWNWVLEEGLEDFGEENYAMYGLPLFKATALKYGFDNPIGDDTGSEEKYNG
jgi:hypothetical protein